MVQENFNIANVFFNPLYDVSKEEWVNSQKILRQESCTIESFKRLNNFWS